MELHKFGIAMSVGVGVRDPLRKNPELIKYNFLYEYVSIEKAKEL